jgi:tRNA-splicing ligase RtcB (3'-phosphate/5'-hydroxy nucleic acid ligase)
MMTITGKDIIALGYSPGPWFPAAIKAANEALASGEDIEAAVSAVAPHPVAVRPLRSAAEHAPVFMNIRAEDDLEAANIAAVGVHMIELMRLPTVKAGAVMPDACPSGHAPGTIPVGGVVATENAIHPGMHSADICCSMAITIFGDAVDPIALLDAGMKLSHFGGGGRPRGQQIMPPDSVMTRFENNPFLNGLTSAAIEHFATQGDGNHFFYVGRLKSTGDVALVTHHGSRKPGAELYKRGMAIAERRTRVISPETPRHNAWIDADTEEGEDYWHALQTIRRWTKASHFMIHDLVAGAVGAKRVDRFWNEHNFVFQKPNGLFYHAKGATPAYDGFADDDTGLTLIPLNMAEPILITRGLAAPNGLGFAPHGAGRNFSRTAYMRQFGDRPHADIVAEQTKGIDARFFCGVPDISELPGAYKNAASMRAQIDEFGLANVVDTVEPVGSIMAGDWQVNAPWRKKKGKR